MTLPNTSMLSIRPALGSTVQRNPMVDFHRIAIRGIVPPVGFEPTLPKERTFEARVSASFTKGAKIHINDMLGF